MKLKTLNELGATNKAGCLKLLQEWNSGVYINQVLETPNYWPEHNDRMSTLIARYHRFNDGIYDNVVDGLEKLLEQRAIDIAERGESTIVDVESILAAEKVKCRIHPTKHTVSMSIACLQLANQYSKAYDLAESYDMTIYTCKSCSSWHIIKNDQDPICPDCEYSLDEVL